MIYTTVLVGMLMAYTKLPFEKQERKQENQIVPRDNSEIAIHTFGIQFHRLYYMNFKGINLTS